MSKKNNNLEILENIKKNDPRFKDLEIVKSCLDFPTYEQFLKDCEKYEQKIMFVFHLFIYSCLKTSNF